MSLLMLIRILFRKYMTIQSVLALLAILLAAATILFVWLMVRLFFPTPPEATAHGIKVACVGDSITFGPIRKRRENSYPGQLQSLLGDSYQVLNYGHGGRTLLKSGESPYWNSAMFTASHQSNPELVLIMIGTNDSKLQNWKAADFEKQLAEFVRTYQNLAIHPKPHLMTPPAAFRRPGKKELIFKVNDTVIENEIVPIVKRVAAKMDIPVIDIFSATKDHPEYFEDGVHPTPAGYAIIAKIVFATLQKQQ